VTILEPHLHFTNPHKNEILEELVALMKNNSQTICINRKEYKNKYSELERMCELRRYIYTKKPNDEVTLKILRNNREIEVKAKLGRR